MRGKVSIPSSSGPGFGPTSEGWYPTEAWMFQSPLHRGLGSDMYVHRAYGETYLGFNPLFIGAWVRTRRAQALAIRHIVSIPSSSGPGFGPQAGRQIADNLKVSIPSSSGPGFGPDGTIPTPAPTPTGFNPLFIGAWVRTSRIFAKDLMSRS